ncbi:hypothetical protein KY308_03400 [Candidatus Woesearchaeota archaeon]|nr:hypothetical protein [Candidatus Woesearchaeota archaeon]
MHKLLEEASEELKRADHLIYVSLKYTRTVDVIKSIVERLVNAYDLLTQSLLKKQVDEGKLESIPESPLERAKKVAEIYDDEKVKKNIELYLMLRKIMTAAFDRAREFRRHVTMTAKLKDGTTIDVDIDKIYEYYNTIKDFFIFVRSMGDLDND